MKFESQLQIVTAAGVAPFTVNQTQLVINLNADLLDGQEGSFYQNAGNLNAGTVPSARLSGSYSIDITGYSAAVVVSDSRSVTTTPQTINRGVVFDFKENATDGLADGGTYFGEMTFRQYGNSTDWSGGKSHQLGFTDNGNIWQRSGSSTTWGAWKKLLDSTNYSSYALSINGGSVSGTLWIYTTSTSTGATPVFPFGISRQTSRSDALLLGVDGNADAVIAANDSALRLGKVVSGVFTEGAKLDTSGNLSVVGTLTEGGYLAFPERVYALNLTAQSSSNFYPIVINGAPGGDVWHHRFSLEMPSQSGTAPYNMDHLYGDVRGGGWTDQIGFYRVLHDCYEDAERSLLGIYKGDQSFYGVVVYVRGGQTYYVRTTSRSVTAYTAATTLGGSTFAIKNAAGADVSGTSAAISQLLNLIGNPQGFYSSYNGYVGTDKVLTAANYNSYALPLSGGTLTGGLVGTTAAFSGQVSSGGNNGFANATWFSNVRNPIWYFGNASTYGISYFQGSSGIGSADTIGIHPNGTATSAGSAFAVTPSASYVNNNVVLHAANYSSYALPLTGGTLTGALQVNNDSGIRVSYDAGGSYAWLYGYGIEFGRVTSYLRPTTNRLANLWVGGTSINGNDWANIDFYSSGRFNINNNAILHAGNYNSYALPLTGGTLTGNVISQSGMTQWSATVPGTGQGNYHIGTSSGVSDTGGAITFGARDSGSGLSAQAGIYIVSGGGFGTKMYLATTDSYAVGSKVAVSIDHSGNVDIIRGALQQGGNQVLHAGNYSSYSPPLAQAVYGENSTATTGLSENSLDTALKSGFYTVTKVDNSKLPASSTSVNFLIHCAYYGVGNLAGIDLLTQNDTASNLFYRNATGAGKGAWRTIIDSSNYNSYALPLTGGTLTGLLTSTYTTGSVGWNNFQIDAAPASGGAYIRANRATAATGEVGFIWATGGTNKWINYLSQNSDTLGWYQGSAVVMTLTTGGALSINGAMSATSFSGPGTGLTGTASSLSIGGNAATATTSTRLSDTYGSLRLANPGGASYATGTSSIAGAIKIKLPTASFKSNTMLRFTVRIYEYSGGGSGTSRTIEIGGYNYSDTAANWYNVFATQSTMGGGDINVRFGNDGTSQCVWIGEVGGAWVYPQVTVTDFQAGYSNQTDAIWSTGWAISFATSFDTVTQGPIVAAKPINSQNYSNYALPLSGGTLSGNLTINGNITSGAGYQLRWSDGSASAPGYSFYADTDTGIHRSADNTLAIVTGGVIRVTTDPSGNVGVGVVPSAWASTYRALQIGGYSSLVGITNDTQTHLSTNARFDGTNWLYIGTSPASRYSQVDNIHRWFNAISGSAGLTIAFIQAMTLDASSNLSVVGSVTAASFSGAGTGLTGTAASLTAGAATNATQINGLSLAQVFNNMGQSHSAYADANNIPGFGFYYLQGSTNGPGNGNGQWYGITLGLGNEYAFSSYACQFAIPRPASGGNPYLAVRYREAGTWGSWSKVYAGYSDVTPWSGITSKPTTLSGYGITDALPLSGGTLSGNLTSGAGYQVRWSDGSASTPGYSFYAETGTGMYRSATNTLAFATGGVLRVSIDGSGNLTATGTVTGSSFSGAGTGLTGAANSLSVGGYSARWATGRTISLTGDVTGTSGAFDGTANLSFAASLANGAVTYAKIQNVAAASVLGNTSASVSQAPQAISFTDLNGYLPGAAKAWVTFNENSSTGAITVNASFGISSVTRLSAGVYQVNFSTAFSDAHYAVSGAIGFESNGSYLYAGYLGIPRVTSPKATGSCMVTATYADGLNYNARYVHVVFHR